MSSLLIVNAQLVNEGRIVEADVYINEGRIEAIGALTGQAASQVLDAKGRYLLPGMIDDQVHFREPGLTNKGDLITETRAAVAGGITSFLDMPNTEPPTLSNELLKEKHQLAVGRSLANYGFYLGASSENIELIKSLDVQLACGVNVFVGSSCASKLVDDPDVLREILTSSPVLVAAHCEDMPLIAENEESYRSIYGDAVPFELHGVIRSDEACYLAAARLLEVAHDCKARVHILHISSAKELELFSAASMAEKLITAEVCPHYLHFSDEDYASQQGLLKCNPAIKTIEDRAALIQGLLEGHLDIIGSAHAPHLFTEKQGSNYFKTPAGMPMVQDALLSLLENYQDGIFSLEFIVEKTSHAVAQLFSIQERGFIREGYWADLVLVDLEQPHVASQAQAFAKCAWTPYDGYPFRSSIAATLVNGELVWHEGRLLERSPRGQALQFIR
ncbi:dihydroorotase [Thiothrix eikelboomii]|uniref:Dihydroorotase n=1 Tax=Thiothrix eikelboomii TaxID=92487 RepID=A0A1T4XTJ2_9GAMM|nr:dihydroorotase [Thiothrix eikelboomii]SKA92415.1 dihydroorotase [Thiothrix eikelboomii]